MEAYAKNVELRQIRQLVAKLKQNVAILRCYGLQTAPTAKKTFGLHCNGIHVRNPLYSKAPLCSSNQPWQQRC